MTKEQYTIQMQTHEFFTPQTIDKSIIELKKIKPKDKNDIDAKEFLIDVLELYKKNPDLIPYKATSLKQYIQCITLGDSKPSFILEKLNYKKYSEHETKYDAISWIASRGFMGSIETVKKDITDMHERIQVLDEKMDVHAIQPFKTRNTSAPLEDYKTKIISSKIYWENEIKHAKRLLEELERMQSIWVEWFNGLDIMQKGKIKDTIKDEQTKKSLDELYNSIYN